MGGPLRRNVDQKHMRQENEAPIGATYAPEMSRSLASIGKFCDDTEFEYLHTRDGVYAVQRGSIDSKQLRQVGVRSASTNYLYYAIPSEFAFGGPLPANWHERLRGLRELARSPAFTAAGRKQPPEQPPSTGGGSEPGQHEFRRRKSDFRPRQNDLRRRLGNAPHTPRHLREHRGRARRELTADIHNNRVDFGVPSRPSAQAEWHLAAAGGLGQGALGVGVLR